MITIPADQKHACPRCHGHESVVPKLLLIGAKSPDVERGGYRRPDQLAADEILPQYVSGGPLRQFVQACFCNRCGIGFVPDEILKPSIRRFRHAR